ncbi:MAG: alpha/beta hydrolase fold domain-containing protein, partial [Pseudomonadota bacterium]|nr:alpha/beta hydrolase fold domain-containing protein [Pseudomonadota bacterium]
IYYHGGGWVIGNIDDYDGVGRHIAERCNAVVVLVNYRKAPEHKFPIPVNDCYAALNWVSENMTKVAGADLPIMVAGDSAGGNLSAVIAQKTVRENGPKIDLQVLVYPVTDGRMNSATWKDEDRQLFLTSELMEHFWRHYADDGQFTDPEASPLLAKDLKNLDGLAPAVVLTAEYDILRDEGAAYAQKLEEAGIEVSYKEFKRQIHGFVGLAEALPVGFEALDWISTRIEAHLNPVDHFDAVVVGAGFSGMYQLHKLREQGLNVRVFEAGSGVGGTWYWNRYPGARVDIESVAYSFSFSEELQQEWVWSEKHATQPELLEYANHVADRFDLRKDIQFETKVVSAHFDDDNNEWLVTLENGDAVRARYLIMASGVLSASKKPDIPGYDNFKGETYNTGSWPHDPVEFRGKKVAIIGTGSSRIQTIPIVAEQAEELVVFQRTANFSTPALNRALSDSEVQEVKKDYAGFRNELRKSRGGFIS